MKRLWLILFLFSQPFSQTTVAVLEFETEGLENISSSALSSIVRREVRNNKEYRLIDRNMMKAVLEEQGFQQSGCVSSECAVQVGELLGVQKMVTGTVSGLGSLYLVEIFILDVATGLIEESEMFEHVGRVEELIKPLRDNTKKLFGDKSSDLIENTFLYIESEPAGGMVYIDNNNIGSTPVKYKVGPGNYKVIIKTQGYQDWMQMASVSLGENKVLSGQLIKFESNSGGSSDGGGIGEWEFWGISKQDYLTLVRLNITRNEWIDSFQANNFTIDIIQSYKEQDFPKNLWVDIYSTNVPISTAKNYYKFSVPIKSWSELYNIGISSNIAEFYYDRSIPTEEWNTIFKTGLTLEEIRSLEENHKLDISILYKYFKEIKLYGVNKAQVDLQENLFLTMNLRFTEKVYENFKYLQSNNSLLKDSLLDYMSKIDGGNDIYFTNDFSKLNVETQQAVYDFLGVDNDPKAVNKKFKNLVGSLFRNMNKRQSVKKYAAGIRSHLSVANIMILIANELSVDRTCDVIESNSKFLFSEFPEYTYDIN